MRITEKIISNGLSRNINKSMGRMDKKYTEISTGKRIHLPSDDPVGLITSMRMKDSIREAQRYKTNSDGAISWLEASDAALGEMTKVLHRFEEVAVAAANGTLTPSSREGLAQEVKQLKNHVLQIANTQHERRYLFSGQQTMEAAYDQNFTYRGDDRPLTIEAGAYSQLDMSVTGNQVFGDFFTKVDSFMEHIAAGNTNAVTNTDLKEIQTQLDKVLDVRAGIGAKVNRLEKNVERLDLLDIQYNRLLSNTEDVDVSSSVMELKMQESVYEAALAVGARIMQTTLMDYLK